MLQIRASGLARVALTLIVVLLGAETCYADHPGTHPDRYKWTIGELKAIEQQHPQHRLAKAYRIYCDLWLCMPIWVTRLGPLHKEEVWVFDSEHPKAEDDALIGDSGGSPFAYPVGTDEEGKIDGNPDVYMSLTTLEYPNIYVVKALVMEELIHAMQMRRPTYRIDEGGGTQGNPADPNAYRGVLEGANKLYDG